MYKIPDTFEILKNLYLTMFDWMELQVFEKQLLELQSSSIWRQKYVDQGRRPRETGGVFPPKKFEVGDGPCIGPPNILRSSVVGWARKLEERKNRCRQGIFFERGIFVVKKVSYVTFDTIKTQRI